MLGGRFVVGEAIGSGGMGSIHQGRDERLGAPVAIKLLKRSLLEDPIIRERFRREALSLAKLRHPGIVTVLDFGEADGDMYTVLELVEGETLEQAMARDGAMTIAHATSITDQILTALEVCHDGEIIHRDIKPANVMLTGEERVKLIDFGLARMIPVAADALQKLTETGVVQGTPSYMAPEQCRGETVVPATDVYAAGVVLYEMLAGSPPFQGKDTATVMAQHLFVEPPALHEAAPHVSAGLSAAVHAALAKQPEDRPTARVLRAAIAAALGGTDPASRGAAAADLRHRVSGITRQDRAIGSATAKQAGAGAGNVVVWMTRGDRSAALRSCLATAGVSSTLAGDEDVPAVKSGDMIVIVIVSAKDGIDRARRAAAALPRAAIVVIDVAGPEQTTEAIRAGARDMLLEAAPDADLVPKLERLLRRRGR